MEKLENKVAIITGGAGSIGLITAKLFLQNGAKIMLVDVNEDSLKNAVTELQSPNVDYCVADVTQNSDVEKYAQKTVDKFGKIDVFFNNAGIEGVVKPITESPEDNFDKVIAVNVKGVWLGMKHVLPRMNDGGSVIITSSVAGLIGISGMTAYNASKHATIGTMRATAQEAAPRKIRVNTVNPGTVDNRMMRSLEEGMAPGHAEAVKAEFIKGIPLGRYVQPEEVANVVLYLASDDSQFITATINVVDGGMAAY
jgi:NAD(P)-dependent dehydrogenase (short-subunit alcohol dehydrogenase family)